MARLTHQERDRRFQLYCDHILHLFLTEGWTSVTYTRLAKDLNLTKSTLQGYFPSNKHFSVGVKGKILPIIAKQLDFSCEEALLSSWVSGIQTNFPFRHAVQLMLIEAQKDSASPIAIQGIERFEQTLSQHFPEVHEKLLEQLLGKAVLILLDRN
ncbi:hypothetical protein [Vibrio tapetis]|uniref:HTH tetR-type domain-containing protein n=1 Tax=Vibrio tapetis subsp. tapetis TaxID=1671868 RepID=A0A2N8ZM68_9VIBR|nr:hypothetical protein [Vibrio tapetis]SON52969.1 conserved protein of unknown function [Vibrio tapetis subsp. tapetis]